MIISASRRTDIPAFYSDWFMQRIRAGYFYRVNPFNSRQVTGFSLKPEDVAAICFWTKYPLPLMPYLAELDRRGFCYYFQFTLNPYGKLFEPKVPAIEERIAVFRELAERLGPERVIWRYDPVILSSVTPVSWHLEQAEQLARQLHDSTRRFVFSFYDFYGRGQGRLGSALKGTDITLHDITATENAAELDELVQGFKAIAARFKLRLLSCSEQLDLSAAGIEHGACIDAKLIRELSAADPSSVKDRNQRSACGCVESADMGSYNSCLFCCSYCYANFNAGMIARNCQKHSPDSPSLLGRHDGQVEIRTFLHKKKNCAAGQAELYSSGPG